MTDTRTHLGDGLYAELDRSALMIILRAPRADGTTHWVGLEPEVFVELLRFARRNGWGNLIKTEMAREERDG
jgi:hypothetical protein